MKVEMVKAPTVRQLLTLRLMIMLGLICMGFFLYSLLKSSVVGYKPLYWLLMSTFIYTFFKIVYEWYHYWAISVPETPPATKQYTVDIFTTFCAGEPYDMIVETLTAIKAITYPHQTYLCDEANDPYLKSVCENLGVHHITRIKKINAKAGNINNALNQSDGELCVILDPDHIPVPGFLDPIVSHFDNPEIGYVQVVQAYYNQDIGWIAKGAAQQTYQFYGPMMMCMNTYGTVQAIGANCTFRRTALDSIGGHAAGLAEDMHTAMQLHAKKWKSVYVPQILTRGLVPATLSAYYKQQIKWSRGVFELLVTSYVQLFTKFNWRQKLHYGLLPFFYLSGFVFLINFLLPVIALFASVFPLRMDFSDFLIISIPFVTSIVLIRHFVQQWVMEDNERGFHVIGGLLLIGTWWVFILGFIYTVIRKDVPYIATPKDVKDEKNLKNNLPNIFILVISITAIAYGLYNDWNPFTLFMSAIVSLNCLFMIFMLVASSELKLQEYLKRHTTLLGAVSHVNRVKQYFWLFRRKVYTGVRKVSLLLTVFIICVSLYASRQSEEVTADVSFNIKGHLASYSGNNPFVEKDQKDTAGLFKFIQQNRSKKAPGQLSTLSPDFFSSTRGVIYSKGSYWYKNIYPLTKRTIVKDFSEMKKAGINSVKIYGPNFYDHSTFAVAKQQDLKIYYSFWIPDPSDFVNDSDHLKKTATTILKTVDDFKSNPSIVAWNLGNSTFQQLDKYYAKSQLYYARYNYIKWLKKLVNDIKLLDKNRHITIDILASANLNETVNLLHEQIPQLDAFGVVLTDKMAYGSMKVNFKAPYFISSMAPGFLRDSTALSGSIFYANWQDQQSGSTVTFDGLKDIWGRNKPYLHQVSKNWNGNVAGNNLPNIKILRPALTVFGGSSMSYSALVYVNNEWRLASDSGKDLKFEWYLVKTDKWGNAIGINPVGRGTTVNVQIPQNIYNYRLYLVATKGNNATDYLSTLHTPLKN